MKSLDEVGNMFSTIMHLTDITLHGFLSLHPKIIRISIHNSMSQILVRLFSYAFFDSKFCNDISSGFFLFQASYVINFGFHILQCKYYIAGFFYSSHWSPCIISLSIYLLIWTCGCMSVVDFLVCFHEMQIGMFLLYL